MKWLIATSVLALSVLSIRDIQTPADEPKGKEPTVVATWGFRVNGKDAAIKLFSNGRINEPDSKNTWVQKGDTLILRWPDPKAPGGAWQDTCKISADGKSFTGRNQLGNPSAGKLISKADAPVVVAPPKVDKTKQDPAKAATEFVRFAEFATMESYHNDIYFDRTAPWRAGKLRALKLTDPTLREAADIYTELAIRSHIAVAKRDAAYWSPKEIEDSLRTQIYGTEAKANQDLVDKIDETFSKVKSLEEANKIAFENRVLHSMLWDAVLKNVKPVGGPEREKFPLRFGIGHSFWVRNASGKPLTNLTLAVRTHSSSELPADADLHVIFLERLEADEWIALPGRLLSKLYDQKTRAYKPGSKAFRCSVWSSEVQFERVEFDVKALPARAPDPKSAPNGWCKFGCFPNSDFRGEYDDKSPWPVTAPTARWTALAGNLYVGTDSATRKEHRLRITDLHSESINVALQLPPVGDSRNPQMGYFEGKLQGDKFELERVIDGRLEPSFPTRLWGTLKGDEMELSYGKGKTADGKVSLKYVPRAKKK